MDICHYGEEKCDTGNRRIPVGIKSGEDLLTWARLSIRGQIAFCKTPLAIYNLGEGL